MATARKVASFLIVPLFLMCLLATTGSLTPAAAQVQVNSASPNTAAQATVNLNVIIKGKGFKKGAVAKWQVTGTEDPGGVTVNSTTFVSSTELVANIDVTETAVISLYDIAVRNSDGRTGKGTELFSVTEKTTGNSAPACSVPVQSLTSTNSCSGTGAGCLDTTFDADGWAYVDTTGNPSFQQDIDGAYAIAIQPDGKIVTGGDGGGGSYWTLIRWNPDGSLDPTFGSGGVVHISSLGSGAVFAVVIQAEGKILLTGPAGPPNFVAARLNADGSLDATFGSGGIAQIGFGRKSGSAHDVAVQSDGKVVLFGSVGADAGIVRLNPNGTLDPTFGSGGIRIIKVVGAWTVVMQPVNVSGSTVERILIGGGSNFAIMRFDLAGNLDTSFGPKSDGKVFTNLCGNTSEQVRAITLDAAGNIVAAGTYTKYDGITGLNFVVARYTANGILDTTFGQPLAGSSVRAGYSIVDFLRSNDTAWGVAAHADGKIVLSGSLESPDGVFRAFAVARFNPDGLLDSSFGQGGVAVAHLAAFHDNGRQLALQPDGKIVVAGNAGDNGYQSAVVRFWH